MRLRRRIFLRAVVAGNPPGGVVAREGKLRQFLLNIKIGEVVLHGELVAESQSVVVEAEAHLHHGGLFGVLPVDGGLLQRDEKLIVVVANLGFFAPYGLPRLVERARGLRLQHKAGIKAAAVEELESQSRGQQHSLLASAEGVVRHAIDDGKPHLQHVARAR